MWSRLGELERFWKDGLIKMYVSSFKELMHLKMDVYVHMCVYVCV